MKRLAFAAVLLCLASLVCLCYAADEPTTTIKLSFCAEHVKGREVEGKAAWEAFCATVEIRSGDWKTAPDLPSRGDIGHGTCTLSLTHAQFTAMLDALKTLMANAAFRHCYADFRITSER